MRRLASSILRVAVACAIIWPTEVEAQPGAAHHADKSVVFFVFESDPLERRAAVLRALDAHFASAGPIEVIAVPRAKGLREQADRAAEETKRRGRAGAFWVDLASGDEATLFFVEPDAQRILVRRIPWREAEAMGEAVAVVTRSTTDALSSGASIGMEPAVVEPPRPPPPVPPPPLVPPPQPPPFDWSARTSSPQVTPPPVRFERGRERGLRLAYWHFAASYAGAYVSESLPWSSGVAIEGGFSLKNGLRAGFTASGFPPLEATLDDNRISIGRASLAGELGYEKSWEVVALGATGAPFVELVHRSTAAAAGTLRAQPPELTPLAGLRATADLTLRPDPAWGFRLSAGPEIIFNPLDFAVREEGQVRVLESFSPIRATALLGLEVRK
ncbi:MAG: hypothetical protein HOV80_09315 [Polyangiaceae bacterium]|nr:hypothetical protein [Polyangiaceae bacterium]